MPLCLPITEQGTAIGSGEILFVAGDNDAHCLHHTYTCSCVPIYSPVDALAGKVAMRASYTVVT